MKLDGQALARLVVSVLMALGVAAVSRVPVPAAGTSTAVLRLSWKTVGARVQVKTADDPSLPPHMRVPGGGVESRLLPYRLRVSVNRSLVLDRVVRPGGVHQDRPLGVLDDIALPVGLASVEVSFDPLDPAPADAPHFAYRGEVDLRADRVALVTLDPEGRTLELQP